jgi:hypothetical protein
MRARTRIFIRLVAGAAICVSPAAAVADASAVYQEFVNTHRISCNHSKGDLQAIKSNATVNQYGDPLTLADLKLAAERNLVRGCYIGGSTTPASSGSTSPGNTTGAGGSTSTSTSTPAQVGSTVTGEFGNVTTTTAPSDGGVDIAAGPVDGVGDGGTSTGAFVVIALVVLLVLGGCGIAVRRVLAGGR